MPAEPADSGTESGDLDAAIARLESGAATFVREVLDPLVESFRKSAKGHLRELQRELTRLHLRISARSVGEVAGGGIAAIVRSERAILAERWRATLIARAEELRRDPCFDLDPFTSPLLGIARGAPVTLLAPFDRDAYTLRAHDPAPIARRLLRARWRVGEWLGAGPPRRVVPLQALALFHLAERWPLGLEPMFSLRIEAETHLTNRLRSLFEGLAQAHEELVLASHRGDGLAAELVRVRADYDTELDLIAAEVDRAADGLAQRAHRALDRGIGDVDWDARIAGGPGLRRGRRRGGRAHRQRLRRLGSLSLRVDSARSTAVAVQSRLALELELMALDARARDLLDERSRSLEQDLVGQALRQVARVREAVVQAHGDVVAILKEGDTGVGMAARLRRATEDLVHQATDGARISHQLRMKLSSPDPMNEIVSALQEHAGALSEAYRIPAGNVVRGERRLPPPLATVEVPFRAWALARIEAEIAPRLRSFTATLATELQPLVDQLRRVERHVSFNSELATAEVEAAGEETVPPEVCEVVSRILAESMEPERLLLEELLEDVSSLIERARRDLQAGVLDTLGAMRTEIVEGEVGRLRSRMLRELRGSSRAAGWARVSGILSELVGGIARRVAQPKLEDEARTPLALPAAAGSREEPALAAPEPRSVVPMAYRRLLSAPGLDLARAKAGRESELADARAILAGTQPGARVVAIVGPTGVGKRGLQSLLTRQSRWPRVIECDLDAPTGVEAMDALFEQVGEGHLVTLKGLEWLFALRPGGLSPLRHFVERLHERAEVASFLLSVDSIVWHQVCELTPLRAVVSRVLRVDPLDLEGLEAAVIGYHDASGYGLRFRGDAGEDTSSPRAREAFFRDLHAASGGVLQDALRAWLAAIVDVDAGHVHLGPLPPRPTLEATSALLLYQIARQGWMDASTLAFSMRVDPNVAEARLEAECSRGLLQRRGDVYVLRAHLRGAVRRLLATEGLLPATLAPE